MENKLTWVEFKKIVARQTNLTEKETNLILNTWLDEMTAALQRGEDLHINGLGTFRLKTMKARKSVNVTTGEPIILPETKRLTYTMASGMDEELNSNAPRLEVGIDPIKKLSDQADEIMDILGELGQGEKATQPTETIPIPVPVTPQPAPTPSPQAPKQEEQKQEPQQGSNPKPNDHLWLTALITIVVFLLVLVGLFLFFQHHIEKWLIDLREKAEMVNEVPDDLSDAGTTIAFPPANDTLAVDSVMTDSLIEESEPIAPQPREYTEFIGTEEMHQDSRLAWMAYRYYGNKALWVFIYDANRDHLSNPERIPVGTPIKIPKLDETTIQLATPELQTLVQDMADEFLKK
ncbi:MAG: HU family DNA-binding protein [Paludibacteraceae bacterium]|nr:HU family DNA-binding protein [Paludibacteraceae bacterium]